MVWPYISCLRVLTNSFSSLSPFCLVNDSNRCCIYILMSYFTDCEVYEDVWMWKIEFFFCFMPVTTDTICNLWNLWKLQTTSFLPVFIKFFILKQFKCCFKLYNISEFFVHSGCAALFSEVNKKKNFNTTLFINAKNSFVTIENKFFSVTKWFKLLISPFLRYCINEIKNQKTLRYWKIYHFRNYSSIFVHKGQVNLMCSIYYDTY